MRAFSYVACSAGSMAYKVHACHIKDWGSQQLCRQWLGSDNKKTLVKVRERSRFWLNVNKHFASEVTVNVFSMKPDHDLSLTSTRFCECLNITIQSFNNAADTTSGFCTGRSDAVFCS